MALKTEQQEAFDYLSKTFPNMSIEGKAKLIGIWEGESNLKKTRTEEFPLFVNEKAAAKDFKAGFQVLDSYPTEASIVKKYKTEAGSPQTKNLLAQERSLWSMPKDREQWFKEHKERYGVPSFDPSKSHKENKKIQNAALAKLSEEQRVAFEKEFYDQTYKKLGGYYTRGIGPIQVTGMDNIVKSLNTAAGLYNKPEWAELAKIVKNEPEKIESLIRNNPELETALSMGWVTDNLVTKEGDLKPGSLKKINTIVNTGNKGYDEKNKAYLDVLSVLNQPKEGVPLTPEETRNYAAERDVRNYSGMEPGIEKALEPRYATMEDLLNRRGIFKNELL
jgi:predicted chitinase